VVIIQTSEPENRTLQQVVRNDYETMARCELEERHAFSYPPYSRLLRLTLREENLPLLRRSATDLTNALRQGFGGRVLGPVTPPVDRIRGEYIIQIIIKIENGRSMTKAREILRSVLEPFYKDKQYKNLKIAIDVDAQ
jgi:primosomal protein N' (replication factor Y)